MAERRMLERLEAGVATLLRLPAAGPEPPPGSGQVLLFRAAPRYLQYNLGRWVVSQAFGFLGLAGMFGVVAALPPELWFIEILETIGIVVYLVQLPILLGVVWLDYDRRWYLVTDRSLRIREGVWTVHERTMSFANVQNLDIRQGPIYRLLGLASLEVHSAGGGQVRDASGTKRTVGEDLHVASFRGVDNAPEIRDLILARLRAARGAGLGDPDEEHDHHASPGTTATSLDADTAGRSTAALSAASDLLAEARALRSVLSAYRPR